MSETTTRHATSTNQRQCQALADHFTGYRANRAVVIARAHGNDEGRALMANQEYDAHAGARLLCQREYLGITAAEMADELGVQLRSYTRWETGSDPLPVPIRDRIDGIVDSFDDKLAKLIAQRPTSIVVPRFSQRAPRPSMLRMLVARAMRELPDLVPRYADEED